MHPSDVAARRLVNLTMALLAARRPLTVAEIVTSVEGYGEHPDPADDSVRRTFERDKQRLRSCGIPVEVVGEHNDEVGYRIPAADALLPPVQLTAGEAAALAVAARSWSQRSLAALADRALAKLEAAGGVRAATPRLLVQPRLDGEGAALDVLLPAQADRQVVQFGYQAASGALTQRTLEPWGVVSWRRRWYVTGLDRDRGEQRTFRISRIVDQRVEAIGKPDAFAPPDVAGCADLRAQLEAFRQEDESQQVVVQVRPAAALALRAQGEKVAVNEHGWDVLELPVRDLESFAGWVRTFAGDVLPVSPPVLVEAVRAGWEAVAR